MTDGKTYSEVHPEDGLEPELTPEQVDNLVLYEMVEKHIALITLNRPERGNAMLAPHSFLELRRKMERAEDDDDVKVIILTGAGTSFCAGVDLRRTPIEDAGLRPGERLPQSRRMRMQSFRGPDLSLMCDKTVICAVNGACVAAGFHYMISLRYCHRARRARSFGEPESRSASPGSHRRSPSWLLKVGVNRARAMFLTGRIISADEFRDWGWSSRLFLLNN